MLYDIIYALAARGGREAKLFGDCAPLAQVAFARSLASEAFPELWFELPLTGNPWFDLHALTARDDVRPGMPFAAETCGGHPEAFEWFAAQEQGVRQLALSWDVSKGDVETPAVQLLVNTSDARTIRGFLASVGREDAASAYCAFAERLPDGWFACYTGLFPERTAPFLRVECIPDFSLQAAYAKDAALLEAHLRQVGLAEMGDTLLSRCRFLAHMPFQLEFQFDVSEGGCAGATFSASARFAQPPGTGRYRSFDASAEAGELMRQLEAWELADGRWRLLSDTAFAQRASYAGNSCVLYCYPAFIKLRWRNGQPVDAKTYLIAGAQ